MLLSWPGAGVSQGWPAVIAMGVFTVLGTKMADLRKEGSAATD
jgi:hypothetical protein